MNIKITADSTCDLSQELVKQFDIEIVPLSIIKGGIPYKDGLEISPEDIFAYVESGQGVCTSAAVNTEDYIACFQRFSSQYDAVIHINISAEFSSCFANAKLAAAEFPNVYAVDSRNLSTGSGHIVLQAACMAQAGLEPRKIVDALNVLTGKVEASFVLDKLDYLQKGGRCSSLTKLGANLLRLKPCIEVVNGEMHVGKKYRGSFDRSLKQYVYDRLQGRNDIVYDRIFITHTGCDPALVNDVRKIVQEVASFSEITETRAGCTISSHCGPNTLGVLFIRK